MRELSWRDRSKVALAYALIKLKRLRYDHFTEAELNELIAPHFPIEMPIAIPVGQATLRCIEGKLSMAENENRIDLQLLCGLSVQVLATPIYRAHFIAQISAKPHYLVDDKKLTIEDVSVGAIHLVNDEYSLLRDTSDLIDRLTGLPVSGLLSGPLKSALGLVTAGSSTQALNYLQLYLQGNKQRVLDNHRPQIEQAIIGEVTQLDLHYAMQASNWREYLFANLGQTVVVEHRQLRFYF